MEEKIIDVLDHYWFSRIGKKEAVERLLNLHIVMLSETLEQAEKKADKIDEIQDPSGMEAVGFSNGADWVVKKLKEKIHSA